MRLAVVLAHGLGDAAVLPFPLPVALVAAGGGVLAVSQLLSRRPPGRPARRGLALPSALQRALDAPALRTPLQLLGLAAALVTVALAALGPDDPDANPAPRLVFVILWAGLVPLALVAPGAPRALSPLRGASTLLGWATGDREERGTSGLPSGIGWRPAVAALLATALVVVCLPATATVALIFLVVYGIAQVAAAAIYGSSWYAAGDGFEVLADVTGRLSPLRRRPDGRLRLTSPRIALGAPVPPGGAGVVAVLLGTYTVGLLVDTDWWALRTVGWSTAAVAALSAGALLGCAALLLPVVAAVGRRGLLPALLPLIPAWALLHYTPVLLIEGQVAFSQLGATLAGGVNAVSDAQLVARYELMPAAVAAVLQLFLFWLPHLAAAVAAHDLAVTRYGPRRALAAAAGTNALLTISVLAGITLRFAA